MTNDLFNTVHSSKLSAKYDELYKNAVNSILVNNYQTDANIDNLSDNRLGITLLIRPSGEIAAEIGKFLNELNSIDPEQYYYPNSDLHITVCSIISCYEGFSLDLIKPDAYLKLLDICMLDKKSFNMGFRGITASPSCVMIRGFFDNTLNEIRENIRHYFQNSSLQQSIDERYVLQTGHITAARFRKQISDKEAYLDVFNKYLNHDFGSFNVNEMELVFNDWYQRKERVKTLGTLKLKSSEPSVI
jgi:2'-5' RNA ligase